MKNQIRIGTMYIIKKQTTHKRSFSKRSSPSSRLIKKSHNVRFSVSDSSTYLTTNLFLENDDEISFQNNNLDVHCFGSSSEVAENNKEKMIVVDNITELLRKNNKKRRFERRLSRTPNKLLNDAHEILRQQYEENSIRNNNNVDDDDENSINNSTNGKEHDINTNQPKSTDSLIKETLRLVKSLNLTM
mmetsp:Transcript_11267/g.12088  ORF Transcript_11267/g.12088 Transcript_11267/m.12088 type:complete len:188 (+) Transcript_11267:127-690(+)